MKLLINPPFDSPIAPRMLSAGEFASILAEHGIEIVAEPERADLELCGGPWEGPKHRLPKGRVVVIDGEPPQPEYMLPHYLDDEYAEVITPLNGAYDPDGMAFYEPPRKIPTDGRVWGVCQLATYRGNSPGCLCGLRSEVGLRLHEADPEFFHLCGNRWPVPVRTCTRGQANFLEVRHQISAGYAFDFCWENVELSGYVSEKFWSPLLAGTLPLYYGPEDFEESVPRGTFVRCREYDGLGGFNALLLLYDLSRVTRREWLDRVSRLQDWYHSLPTDSAHQSHVKSAHTLARILLETAEHVA